MTPKFWIRSLKCSRTNSKNLIGGKIRLMTRGEIYYLLPYLVSLAIPCNVLAYTWTKRHARGAVAFAWYTLGQILWMTGFIFETASAELSAKLFWESFQWVSSAFVVALPVFAVQYTDYKIPRALQIFQALFFVPAIFVILIFLEPYTGWIYTNPRLVQTSILSELEYDFSPIIITYAIGGYVIALSGIAILTRHVIHTHSLYNRQIILIIIGFLIPVFGSLLGLLNIPIPPQHYTTPFSFAAGDLIIAWGLFRYQIFEITQIAREKIFEAMVEPVVIVDNNNRIVDINRSMTDLLDQPAEKVIGKAAKEVFQNFPIPIKRHLQTNYARAEAVFNMKGKQVHYEMTVWPLFDAKKNMTGRIFISHDITALKELESELRKLNAELEDRVRARTRDLAEAYDTTLEGWARALELRDKETIGHTRRVTELTLKIAYRMGIRNDEDLEQIRRGAILHDIGKMGISDKILLKPGKLTQEERAIMQQHPLMARQLLEPIPFLQKALDIPYCHHEKWDGTGYPRGLKGEEIPLAARIFAVVDVWDAISSERPYKKAWTREKSISYFISESGKHFDPKVVNVFLSMLEKGEI